MLVEGIGGKAPQSQRHGVSVAELRILAEVARERAKHRQYRAGGRWNRGLVAPMQLPGICELSQDERPVFVGLIGEFAAQQYIDRRFPEAKCVVDTSLLPSGDFGIDLKPFGLKIDVKTREFRAGEDGGINRIRRTKSDGRTPVDITASAFLFAEWNRESPTSVWLLGWQWTAFVMEQPLMPSVGSWFNACVFDRDMLPMSRFGDELETWKARKAWR